MKPTRLLYGGQDTLLIKFNDATNKGVMIMKDAQGWIASSSGTGVQKNAMAYANGRIYYMYKTTS